MKEVLIRFLVQRLVVLIEYFRGLTHTVQLNYGYILTQTFIAYFHILPN
jgi:hypothetical protein